MKYVRKGDHYEFFSDHGTHIGVSITTRDGVEFWPSAALPARESVTWNGSTDLTTINK